MSWYNENGPESDVAVSTRCRFARSISPYKFPSKLTQDEAEHLSDSIAEGFFACPGINPGDFNYLKTKNLKKDELLTLFEKHLISLDMVKQTLPGGIILSKNEEISVMLCEEDHIRLQAILPGFQPEKAYSAAKEYESLMSGRFKFTKSEKIGYLNSCPTNVGCGMKISAILHLPALTAAKKIGQVSNSLGKLGLTMRGMYKEGAGAGSCLYQISNQVTLGISEEDITRKVGSIIEHTTEAEIKMREALINKKETEIKNRCMRSYGILKNSYSLSFDELLVCLSDVRLGAALGIVDTEYKNISSLLVASAPACLISAEGITNPLNRDIRRAELAREML